MLVVRAQFDEEVEDFVHDFGRASVAPVDLVDDDDRAQVQFERFAQHEARLRHDAFRGVDEQQDALHHLKHALDLTAEVGVAGGVDDVELEVPVNDGGVFGEDRDPALALERVRVHDPRREGLTLAEDATLPEHGIDERRFAVIDVGDDREISDVGAGFHSR